MAANTYFQTLLEARSQIDQYLKANINDPTIDYNNVASAIENIVKNLVDNLPTGSTPRTIQHQYVKLASGINGKNGTPIDTGYASIITVPDPNDNNQTSQMSLYVYWPLVIAARDSLCIVSQSLNMPILYKNNNKITSESTDNIKLAFSAGFHSSIGNTTTIGEI